MHTEMSIWIIPATLYIVKGLCDCCAVSVFYYSLLIDNLYYCGRRGLIAGWLFAERNPSGTTTATVGHTDSTPWPPKTIYLMHGTKTTALSIRRVASQVGGRACICEDRAGD